MIGKKLNNPKNLILFCKKSTLNDKNENFHKKIFTLYISIHGNYINCNRYAQLSIYTVIILRDKAISENGRIAILNTLKTLK